MANAVDVCIGENLRVHREAARVSQSEFAPAIGVSKNELALIERGAMRLHADAMLRAATFLRLEVAEFFRDPAIQARKSPEWRTSKPFAT